MNLNNTRLTIRKYINLSTSILLFTMFLKLSEESDSDINQEDSSHIKQVDLEAGINNLSFQDYVTHGHFQTINLIFFFKYIRQLDEHFSNKQRKELDFRPVVSCKYFGLLNELLIKIIEKAGILDKNMQYDAIINLIRDGFRTKITELFQSFKPQDKSVKTDFVDKKIAEIIQTHDRFIEGMLENLKFKFSAEDSKESKLRYLLVNLNDIIENYVAENSEKTKYGKELKDSIIATQTKFYPILLKGNNISLINSYFRMESSLLNDYEKNWLVNTFLNAKIAKYLVSTNHLIYFIEDYSKMIEIYDKGKIFYNKIKEDSDLKNFVILLNPYEAIEGLITKFREQLNKLMEDNNIKQVLDDVLVKTNEKLQEKGFRYKTIDEFFKHKFDCDDLKEISNVISIEKERPDKIEGLQNFTSKIIPILKEFYFKLSYHFTDIGIIANGHALMKKKFGKMYEIKDISTIEELLFFFSKVFTSEMIAVSVKNIYYIMYSFDSDIKIKQRQNIHGNFTKIR